ncbi:hypothetical protein HDV04_003973 [Boothiomyces sp. JEL0838]|nr:hypothetical protein HDV04_003973 [Boothiomyces sp. JEL0838]
MEQVPFQLFDGGVATSVCKDVFGLVEELHQFSRDCCTLASQLNLMSFEIQKYGTTHQYENLDRLSVFVNQIIGLDLHILSDYWISIFAHGVFKFLESWISFNSAIHLRNKEIVNKKMVIKCVNWYCTFALPGLDYTAHRLLTTVFLSKEWIGQDFTHVQQCFDAQFNIKSLSNSNAFTVLNPSKHPKSLMIQVQQFDQTVLPIQKDWIFKFPAGFKNDQISSADDVLLWLEFVTVGISESIISKQPWEINRIYSVMHLFFLSDESGHEIYRDDRVNDLLAKLLELLTDSIYESYDEGFLEKIPNFFNLYQDFIDHFIATSFGDRVFARYILVPIAMKFPHDFRAAFWGKLFDYKFFDLEEDALPGKALAPFLSPLDTNMDMKILYKKAMLGGRLRKDSFLYKIASQY